MFEHPQDATKMSFVGKVLYFLALITGMVKQPIIQDFLVYFIIGDQSSGKSTLIQKLIGDIKGEVSKAGIGRTTTSIIRYTLLHGSIFKIIFRGEELYSYEELGERLSRLYTKGFSNEVLDIIIISPEFEYNIVVVDTPGFITEEEVKGERERVFKLIADELKKNPNHHLIVLLNAGADPHAAYSHIFLEQYGIKKEQRSLVLSRCDMLTASELQKQMNTGKYDFSIQFTNEASVGVNDIKGMIETKLTEYIRKNKDAILNRVKNIRREISEMQVDGETVSVIKLFGISVKPTKVVEMFNTTMKLLGLDNPPDHDDMRRYENDKVIIPTSPFGFSNIYDHLTGRLPIQQQITGSDLKWIGDLLQDGKTDEEIIELYMARLLNDSENILIWLGSHILEKFTEIKDLPENIRVTILPRLQNIVDEMRNKAQKAFRDILNKLNEYVVIPDKEFSRVNVRRKVGNEITKIVRGESTISMTQHAITITEPGGVISHTHYKLKSISCSRDNNVITLACSNWNGRKMNVVHSLEFSDEKIARDFIRRFRCLEFMHEVLSRNLTFQPLEDIQRKANITNNIHHIAKCFRTNGEIIVGGCAKMIDAEIRKLVNDIRKEHEQAMQNKRNKHVDFIAKVDSYIAQLASILS